MTTSTLIQPSQGIAQPVWVEPEKPRASSLNYLGNWLLIAAFLFLIGRGKFSFLLEGFAGGGGIYPTKISQESFRLLTYVIFPGFAYSVISWRVFTHIRSIFPIILRMKMITLLALLCICSAAWSQQPDRSLYQGLFYLMCTLFAFYLIVRYPLEDIMSLVMKAGFCTALCGVLLVIFFPEWGLAGYEARTAGAWRGIFEDRTTAGRYLTFLVSPALVFGQRWIQPGRLLYIVVMCASVVMARAMTADLILVAYISFMGVLHFSQRLQFRMTVVLMATIIPIAGCLVWVGAPLAESFVGLIGRDLTLTGRTDVWASTIASAVKHPWLGYGFYSFWLGMEGESGNVIRATHWFFGYAHNGLLEIVLQVGLVGLLLFCITFVHAIKDAFTCLKVERSVGLEWLIGLIFLTILYNIDEESVMFPSDILSILYVLACCGLSRAAARVRLREHGLREYGTQY